MTRRGRFRGLLAFAAALLVVGTLVVSAAAERAERATYRFGPSLAAADREQISRGFALAQRYLPDVAPFVVRAGDEVRPPGVGRRGPFEYDFVAQAGGNRITVFTSGEAYRTSTAAEVEETMVHEYYHLVQEELMGRARPDPDEDEPFVPLWLVEGTAEWVSVRIAAANRLEDYAKARRTYLENVKDNPVAIERFNSEEDADDEDAPDPYDDDPYSIGFLAVELLAERHGGEAALGRFWTLVGEEADWRAAFVRTFGISARRFERELAEWQRKGYPSAVEAQPTPAPLGS